MKHSVINIEGKKIDNIELSDKRIKHWKTENV